MNRMPRLLALRAAACAAMLACAGRALASNAADAADATGANGAAGWIAALLLGVAAAVLLLGFTLRREQRWRAQLQAARVEAQGLADLLDCWQWHSDARHVLTQWRPPRGTPANHWPPPVDPGISLCGHFGGADERALRSLLDAHAPIDDFHTELRLPDGGRAGCTVRAAALRDAQGRFAGYVGTARMLAPSPAGSQSMERAPAHHGGEAPAETEQESFSYTVSHDLRAPIRVVEGFTKILKEDYGRLLDRIGNDHLDRVLGAAARMNSMIDALLALSQLSTQPLARQPVNLSQLASYVADDLRRQSPERPARIAIEPGLQVQGDPTLLRVVLENLLGNAWKYTGKCRDPQIWFGHDPAQPPGSFTVRDNGAGFDMRFADRLFGMFQRLHSVTDFPGTGVGLASVRRIVRRHGGDIWAESEVDRGASFHFTLS